MARGGGGQAEFGFSLVGFSRIGLWRGPLFREFLSRFRRENRNPKALNACAGFRVQGSGFRVEGLGFRV